jgi:hypothetical protein
MGGACGTHGSRRSAYRVLVRRPDVNRPLGRPTRRWKDNIKIDLQELGRGEVDKIVLAQDRDR